MLQYVLVACVVAQATLSVVRLSLTQTLRST